MNVDAVGHVRRIIEYRVFVCFALIVFIPSFFYVVFSLSSMGVGLLFSSSLVLVCFSKSVFQLRLNKNGVIIFYATLVFLVLYQFLVLGLTDYGYGFKNLISFLVLVFLFASALFFSHKLLEMGFSNYKFVFSKVIVFLLLSGFSFFFLKQNFLGYDSYAKSVFPFAEPSHYAITAGPVLFASGFFFGVAVRFCIAGTFFLFGLLFPSLLVLVFSFMMFILFFENSFVKKILILIVLALCYLALFNSDLGDYYYQRIVFSDGSRNLTALVYMQGWEDIALSLKDSSLLGVGFQNLGILSPGVYGEIIYSITGEYKNKNDGGFLVSKIVSELGLVGIFLVIIYLRYFALSLRILIRFVNGNYLFDPSIIFASAIIVAFSVEMFARGYGYFSPGVYLFFISIVIFISLHGKTGVLNQKGNEKLFHANRFSHG